MPRSYRPCVPTHVRGRASVDGAGVQPCAALSSGYHCSLAANDTEGYSPGKRFSSHARLLLVMLLTHRNTAANKCVRTSASHRTCQCRAENACLGTGARPALRRRSSSLLPSGVCLARSRSLVRGALALMVRTRVTCAG